MFWNYLRNLAISVQRKSPRRPSYQPRLESLEERALPSGLKPVITLQPTADVALVGANASFTAAASGTPAPTVQWQFEPVGGKNFMAIFNATSPTLTFPAALSDDGEKFEAVFRNSKGKVTTEAATLVMVVQGPAGATGPQGPTGATGAQGPAGATGPAGSNGATGAMGEQGPAGATGSAGSNGATGATGAQGPVGATGSAGSNGPTGAMGGQGAAGATGSAGSNGATGATGVQGPAGATGSAGSNGATGATGAQGPVGATGPVGSNGATGATGAQGPVGATGPAGSNGATGATGVQGPAGATGPAGSNGATGATGAQGPVGATGATGATGAQGPVGATGATGPAGATGATGSKGIVSDGSISGYAGTVAANGISWVFAGPQETLTLTANETVFVSAEAMLGATAATTGFGFDVGYQLGAGTITAASGGANYLATGALAANTRNDCAVSYIFTPAAAGTYNFGFVVLNETSTALNNNDWVHVSVIVLS